MKSVFTLVGLFLTLSLQAQNQISGKVTDRNEQPIAGANVYLEGTYDGATTNSFGEFSFSTKNRGEQILVISYISFETARKKIQVNTAQHLFIKLREDVTALDAVTLSAGTFSAGDNSKVTVLKPLDVVTTAGVAGDLMAALQTLPGTQPVGEDGRLFVRGGTAGETAVFIDGLRVFQPYTSSANNLPSRGRYSPFLFDGITFSTGGYSAEYGQALSGVLLLNTIAEPDQTETNISLMSVGGGLGHTQKWQKSSLSLNTGYINLSPYLKLVPNNEQAKFKKPYQSFSSESVYRKHSKNGIFKWYTAYELTNLEVLQPEIDQPQPVNFSLKNENLYTNLSYKSALGNGWSFNPGISASYSRNKFDIDLTQIENRELAANLKLKMSKRFNNHIKLHFGGEYIYKNFSEDFIASENPEELQIKPEVSAGFAEADFIFSKKFALKMGFRSTYLDLKKQFYWLPRLSMAMKTGNDGQLSLAYGQYLQQPETDLLKFDQTLEPETATHYILNYQWTRPGYILRAEAYHKEYNDLVKFNTPEPGYNSAYTNEGYGYARGADFFFRDDKSVENLQYWISYSFIDSQRNFRNYPVKTTPQFVANHTASLVTKFWIEELRSQAGFTYTFASGRPYEDPNTPGFMNRKTKNYNSLSFNWAYLLSQQKIIYFSVSNVLGSRNVFNYDYAKTADENGIFERQAITPAADRFFFVGFFWTISSNKSKNQLDNL
ncbi:TonB-dependent receptor [Salinimicrobium sp. MT39]|uniref:TonB-dependent receptor n=1 Tax=Salinimicrobium profundisediminis TaxID=2994553 RepID=A0A9X3CW33_9FLAO|nr:TonB-dependent receptor [Salinimicrobium profundisediminis]MCX2837700.1 TonB-dependent receptor [Salinimicrobium profundisediminis]